MLKPERNIIIPTNMGFEVTDHWRERKGDLVTKRLSDDLFLKAGSVAMNTEGQVALIRKEDGVHWGLPKGHVDIQDAIHYGLDFEKALSLTAARETAEETGHLVKVGGFLDTVHRPKKDGHNSLIYFYSASIIGQTGRAADHETVMVDAEDACHLLVPELADIVELAIDRWSMAAATATEIPAAV